MFDTSRLGAWSQLPFFRADLPAISAAIADEDDIVLPPAETVFTAFDLCQPDQTRVVILGQDPYPTPGHAHGLAFSTNPDVRPLPRSLTNIYREMSDDIGAAPPNGDLRFWARQGVLLLNAVLTVPSGRANGHAGLGWQTLTSQALDLLQDRPRAFLLWGKSAQKAGRDLTDMHLKIETPHPSPLSARRGFFGSRPFSKVNAWLAAQGHAPINWSDPEAA